MCQINLIWVIECVLLPSPPCVRKNVVIFRSSLFFSIFLGVYVISVGKFWYCPRFSLFTSFVSGMFLRAFFYCIMTRSAQET